MSKLASLIFLLFLGLLLGCEQMERKPANKNTILASQKNISTLAGSCTMVELYAVDAQGRQAPASEETAVLMQGATEGNITYSDSLCMKLVTTPKIAKGSSKLTLYLKPTVAGTFAISFDDGIGGLAAGSINLQVNAKPAKQLVFKGKPQALRSACTELYEVGAGDEFGNLTSVIKPFDVSLSSDSPSLFFYSDSLCATPAFSLTVPAAPAVAKFYVKNTNLGLFNIDGRTESSELATKVGTFKLQFLAAMPTQIKLSKDDVRLAIGYCSGPVSMTLLSSFLTPAPVNPAREISFKSASTNIQFFNSNTCQDPVKKVTVPAGAHSVDFYIRSVVSESLAIEADDGPGGFLPGKINLIALEKIPGTMDPQFATNGILKIDFSGEAQLRGAVRYADNRMLLYGVVEVSGKKQFALARVTPSGKLDSSFGVDGKVVIDPFENDTYDLAAAALGSNGTIVLAGSVGEGSSSDFFALRLANDGSLDTGFGNSGKVRMGFGDESSDVANAMAVTASGQIVIVGGVDGSSNRDFGILALKNDGTVESEFGSGGKVITNLRNEDEALAIDIQKDGKIIVAGRAYDDDVGIARYLPNGTLDTTFNDSKSGYRIDNYGENDRATSVKALSNGTIFYAGYSQEDKDSEFIVRRLLADGSSDGSFNADGSAEISSKKDGGIDFSFALVVLGDGKVMLGGSSDSRPSLVRTTMTGLPDYPMFGNEQGVLFPFSISFSGTIRAFAPHSDAKRMFNAFEGSDGSFYLSLMNL